MTVERFSILGFGLLGGSIAQAVRKHRSGCHITAFDVNPASILAAAADRLIDRAVVDLQDAAAGASQADLTLICVPPASVPAVFQAIADQSGSGFITDVTSIKQTVVSAAERTLTDPARFVGGHPMAGGERSGSDASRADLFEGATVVLTPTDITAGAAVAVVDDFWRSLGANVVRMSPAVHDEAVAEISHLPHILASLLMHASDGESRSIIGNGFRDLTRIAAGSPTMWQQILSGNAPAVRRVLQDARRLLDQVDDLLDPAHSEALQEWLAKAATLRNEINLPR